MAKQSERTVLVYWVGGGRSELDADDSDSWTQLVARVKGSRETRGQRGGDVAGQGFMLAADAVINMDNVLMVRRGRGWDTADEQRLAPPPEPNPEHPLLIVTNKDVPLRAYGGHVVNIPPMGDVAGHRFSAVKVLSDVVRSNAFDEWLCVEVNPRITA